ncbi:carboxypeptidase-like regulatory domain-containing protein [Allomuricauda taeanensis]|uniref:carboxypeptidase-like regulatory domain-containing protein n=1 Tax=Flagellimonas taeanensis TaxID=1005926 RepID=UPI002E7C4602|nr:carboxypeptidase-like regulatory domain-containing protein [Allomuricauda taeanensis]MEE1961887.1 carboxypeptidase-like regulatory domain-containing protein [Allomuricauda taeanensis]
MKKNQLIILVALLTFGANLAQTYNAGYRSLQLKDSTRTYKPNTEQTDKLHYRPMDLDIWYPSNDKKANALKFGNLFNLFEQRAVNYQDTEDYSGITNELAQFYVSQLGVGADGKQLLNIETNSFLDLEPSPSKHPVIIYMAGFNGMGFENYKILEALAQNGFLVVSVWSVGRYPGDMTNQKEDMLEQVYDAEFAMRYLKQNNLFNADFNTIGIIGYSWGGMSSAVFIDRNPNTKAFVSLDGTETHYFGEEDENDRFIQEILDSNLLDPEAQPIKYLYLESGDKLDEFQPSKDFNYFRQLNSEKYYLRFKKGVHADFTCIPSILEASKSSVQIYDDIVKLATSFFKESFGNKAVFQSAWKNLGKSSYVTEELYDISGTPQIGTDIEGMVLDDESHEPLPYVNIGILNKEIGTVTDTNGKFMLSLNRELENDTLRISSIGYKPVEIMVNDFLSRKQPISIELEEEISKLNEVVVTAKAFKKKTLGNKTESKFISTGFSYDQLGAEMGVKINVRKTPTFVDAFNFNISYNRLSATAIFRVNFYNIENNRPKENMLTQNIIVPIEPKQVGKITVDLKPYDIVLNDDVMATLEWVETEGENNKGEAIFFSVGMFNSGTLYKKSSQAKFKKHSSMGVGFNIDVRY